MEKTICSLEMWTSRGSDKYFPSLETNMYNKTDRKLNTPGPSLLSQKAIVTSCLHYRTTI